MSDLRAHVQALADDLAGRAARTCPGCDSCDGQAHHTLSVVAGLVRDALAEGDDEGRQG